MRLKAQRPFDVVITIMFVLKRSQILIIRPHVIVPEDKNIAIPSKLVNEPGKIFYEFRFILNWRHIDR